MGSYIYLQRYNKNGELAISKKVFQTVGEESLRNIDGLLKKEAKVEKSKPTVVVIIKNNKLSYKFNLLLDKNVSKEIIQEQIIRQLNNNLLNHCDNVPYEVSFNYIEVKEKK